MDPLNRNLLATAAPSGASVADVFSSNIWTGDSSNREIVSGLDNSANEGVVWVKSTQYQIGHAMATTAQGANSKIEPNSPQAFQSDNQAITRFDPVGYTLGNSNQVNYSGYEYVGWNFKSDPGFFDLVTWTGNGANGTPIPHNLGTTPGMIVIKNTSTGTFDWMMYHQNVGYSQIRRWNQFESWVANTSFGGLTDAPDSSGFRITSGDYTNGPGNSYMAMVFGNDGERIKCDYYTGNGGTQTIDVGFRPQFIIITNFTRAEDVIMVSDKVMDGSTPWYLFPGKPNAAYPVYNGVTGFTSNGFSLGSNLPTNQAGDTFCYMAIAAPQ